MHVHGFICVCVRVCLYVSQCVFMCECGRVCSCLSLSVCGLMCVGSCHLYTHMSLVPWLKVASWQDISSQDLLAWTCHAVGSVRLLVSSVKLPWRPH